MLQIWVVIGSIAGSLSFIISFLALFPKLAKYRSLEQHLGIFINRKQIREIYKPDKKRKTKIIEKLNLLDPEIREEYVHFESRERALEAALRENKNIRFVGEAGVGKTRTAIEVIRKLAQENTQFRKKNMIIIHSSSIFKEIRIYRRFLIWKYKSIILFFDDVDKYIEQPFLLSFISRIRKISKSVQLVCTYRTESWHSLRNTELSRKIQALFSTEVQIPKLTRDEGMKISEVLEIEFPQKFNGTAAEVVLGQVRKLEEYSKFSTDVKKILYAIKLLFFSGNFSPKVKMVKGVAEKIFSYTGDWTSHYKEILDKKYIQEIKGRITIRDFVVQVIIEDYPSEETEEAIIESIVSDLMRLQDFLLIENLWEELFPLSIILSFFKKYDLALKCFLNERKIKQVLTKDQKTQYFMYKGLVYQTKRDNKQAYKCFDKALKQEPNSANSHYSRGISAMLVGYHEEALEDLNKAIELDPETLYFYTDRSSVYIQLGRNQEAKKDLQGLIQKQPENISALYNLALANQQLEEYEEAKDYFEKVIKLDPSHIFAYSGLGIIYLQQELHDEALKILTKAIDMESGIGLNYILRGGAYFMKGDIKQAEVDLDKAVDCNQGRRSYYFRGRLSLDTKKYENAIKDFQLALEENLEKSKLTDHGLYIYTDRLQIDDGIIYYTLATAYHLSGNKTKALESINKALDEGFNEESYEGSAYADRGVFYLNNSNLTTAKDDFDKAIELGLESAYVYRNRGMANQDLGNISDALQDFNRALELDPNYIEALLNRSNLFLRQADFGSAINDCNQILKLNSEEYRALNNRGLAYREQRKYPEALKDLNKAIELAPNFSNPYANRSKIFVLSKDYEKALDDINRALELDEKATDALYTRSAIFSILGEYEKAIKDCNELILYDQNNIGAYNNRGLIFRKTEKHTEALEDFYKVWELSTESNNERKYAPILIVDILVKMKKVECQKLKTWLERAKKYFRFYNENQKKIVEEGNEIFLKNCK